MNHVVIVVNNQIWFDQPGAEEVTMNCDLIRKPGGVEAALLLRCTFPSAAFVGLVSDESTGLDGILRSLQADAGASPTARPDDTA